MCSVVCKVYLSKVYLCVNYGNASDRALSDRADHRAYMFEREKVSVLCCEPKNEMLQNIV